jgi:hypothetical protein
MHKYLLVGIGCASVLLGTGCRDPYSGAITPADVQASNINVHSHLDFESSYVSPGHAGRMRMITAINTVAEAVGPCKLRIDEAQTISQARDEDHPESGPVRHTIRKCALDLSGLSGSSVHVVSQSLSGIASDADGGNPMDMQSPAISAVMVDDPQRVDCHMEDMAGNHIADSARRSDLQLIFTVEAEAQVTADSLRETAGSCSQ